MKIDYKIISQNIKIYSILLKRIHCRIKIVIISELIELIVQIEILI